MTTRNDMFLSVKPLLAATALLLALPGCGDDTASGGTDDDANSGFGDDDDAGTETSPTSPSSTAPSGPDTSDSDNPPTDGDDPGTDDGEPPDPGDASELCDAGDEAFVKRLIPLVHGRKPSSIREVRLLVSMIEQLDGRGVDGRRAVTMGLLRDDIYLDRWKNYLYEELRVNVAGDRRNETCYDLAGTEGDSTALAEFIRDNTVEAQYPGPIYWMPDVAYSALRLDDMSPLLRADTFARLSAPLIAGNVTAEELEEMRVTNFGMLFESSMLGRTTDCLECHRAEWATTDSPDPAFDRHYPVPGFLELGAYGPDAEEASHQRSYGIFRFFNFAVGQDVVVTNGALPGGYISPFGIGVSCGGIRLNPGNSPLGWDPYLMGDYPPGATLVSLDESMKDGFDTLRQDGGLTIGNEQEVEPTQAGAYLMAMHMANRMWTHSMGFPLQVANGFPRNADQSEILQTLADDFVSNGFSLRELIADVANHAYFNQSPPDACGASTAYHMPAVFDPFAKESANPAMRGNGVGDTVHRFGARVLLDSIAQAMWWDKPDVFGAGTGQVPGALGANGCGGMMPQFPCTDEPEDATVLRDLGTFLSDSDSGFSGTDLLVMLRLENEFGQGNDPGMHGPCTGPLGSACAGSDWITQLIDVALDTPEADMWDVASAIKDRMVTEPAISGAAEVAALEQLMGVNLADSVSDVGAGEAEEAARRLTGMLTNTPQFMLAGLPSADHDDVDDPILIVDGTSTQDLCEFLAPMILSNSADGVQQGYTCSADGITLD